MKKMIKCLFFVSIIFITFTECDDKENKISQMTPIEYLEDKGYEIISKSGIVDEYSLMKKDLVKLPYQLYWGLQEVEASEYIGKTIETHKFIVKNHPLDKVRNNEKEQTIVWVMTHDNRMIGGYSLPDYSEPVYGGAYSLEGKTLEEVTKMDFQEWREKWEEKYK